MPCSEAEKYGWCKALPSYEVDGKPYCVFHAPQGQKYPDKEKSRKLTLEEFNNLIYERINKAKKEKTSCDLSGTIFEGDISFRQFDKDNPLPKIFFSWATFSGKANFYGARFSGKANFRWATFSGVAYFLSATFSKKADFSTATFSGEASFFKSKIQGRSLKFLS